MSSQRKLTSDFDDFDSYDEFDEIDDSDDAIGRFLEKRNRTARQSSDYSRELNERMDYYAAEGRRYDDSYVPRQYSYGRDGEARQVRSAQRLLAEERTTDRRRYSSRGYTAPQRPTRSDSDRESRSDGDSRGGLKRTVKSLLVLALCIIAIYYGLMMVLTSGINRERIDTGTSVPPAESVTGIEAMGSTATVKNVLLIGIDDDGGSGSRSDTIMIASIDTKTNTIRLCSILRDNYVSIPQNGSSRINSAYAYGGAELLIQTLEQNFRIDIDDYVSVNMDAMISVVDAVGGVSIEITQKEAEQINRYAYSKNPDVSAGVQHLDGKQAVCYARIRKIDSDFGRTNRQRTLINAIVAQCRSLSPVQLVSLVKAVSPYLTTNMSSVEIATMALRVVPALGNEMEQLSLPIDGSYRSETKNGMQVLIPDLSRNTAALHEFLYGEKN